VFREVASGVKTDRTRLRRLLAQLAAGDLLTATRLERLAPRSSEHPRGDQRQEGRFPVLGDAWADTTTAHGRLMLTVLGGLAGASGT
jgi:DNA invertase Pin-like site-specific DNA recombinase